MPSFICWDGRGQVSAEPCPALSWNGENRGGLRAGPGPVGASRRALHSTIFWEFVELPLGSGCHGCNGCCITGGNQGIDPKKDCRLAPFSVLLPVRPPASVQPLWASVGKIIIMLSSDVVLLLGLNDIKEEKHTVPGTGCTF